MSERFNEEYRRHHLVATSKGAAFIGKAWKDDVSVLDERGASLSDVVAALKRGVDRILDGQAKSGIPPGDAKYVAAMKKVLRSLSPGHHAMLKAHYHAPGRRLTATQLAESAGYASYGAANLQYGMVGKWLWEELPIDLPLGADGNRIYTYTLAVAGNPEDSIEQWVWEMRPEVARAIEVVGLES